MVEGDEASGEACEGLVDVDSALAADGQAAEAVEPSVGPLHDLTVATELLAVLDALVGDARDDPARPALLSACLGIVSLVGGQLVGALARSAASNGPEFIAKAVRDWIAAVDSTTAWIESDSPWENGYCESFNAKLRDQLLSGELFYSLNPVHRGDRGHLLPMAIRVRRAEG